MWQNSEIYFIKNDSPLIMAHRGDSANVPENTMKAFEDAYNLKVDVIETDVRMTKDEELVIFHDSKVDRTANLKGKVSDFTLQELEEMDLGYWFDPDNTKNYPFRGKGLKIITVNWVLENYLNQRFNMDIKNKEPVAAKLLSEKLKKYGAEERVQVGSFHQKQINLFRTYSNAPTSAGPIETYKFIKSAKKWIKSKSKFTEKTYNFISLTIPMGIPPSSFSPKWKLVSPEIIKFAHKSNIAVFVWTINEGEHIKTLLEWNVDGIFTDKPRLMMDILKSTD